MGSQYFHHTSQVEASSDPRASTGHHGDAGLMVMYLSCPKAGGMLYLAACTSWPSPQCLSGIEHFWVVRGPAHPSNSPGPVAPEKSCLDHSARTVWEQFPHMVVMPLHQLSPPLKYSMQLSISSCKYWGPLFTITCQSLGHHLLGEK